MGRYNLRDKTAAPTTPTPALKQQNSPPPAPKLKPVANTADVPRSEISKLQQAAAILRGLHRRCKNQHRRGTWWRHFNAFRRQMAHLVAEYAVILSGGDTGGRMKRGAKKGKSKVLGKRSREDTLRAVDARAMRRKAVADARVMVERRVRFWEEHCLGDWWVTFDELVGDSQYSAIALVLLGVLAEVCDVLGITGRLKDGMGEEVETVVHGRQEGARAVERKGDDEDVGVKIERGNMATVGNVKKRKPEREEDAPRKKRRKNRDAIDDLFSGLA